MTIPKIIHQTVSDKNDLHPVFADNIARLRTLNSEWDYRLYDDEECRAFIASHYDRDMLTTYERIHPRYGPARADLFRYLLLYRTGGVYLDIKSTATKRLDDVLNDDDAYILSHWRNQKGQPHEGWGIHPNHPQLSGRGEYQQWHIVAAAGHQFLDAVIQRVKRNIDTYDPLRDGVGKIAVLRMTGPIAYTLAIQSVQERGAYRLADGEDMGFVFSVLGTDGWKSGRLKHESFFKNHYRFATEPLVLPRFIKEPCAAPRAAEKVGRNEPCPCGSGKKYKHCHGR
jgi:inositol phosphorylceramide mannosyltransferase catalytic subunit